MTEALNQESAARLLEWARDHREEQIELLMEMASLETPSTDPQAQEPMFQLLVRELAALGFETRRIPGRDTGGQLYAHPVERDHGAPAQLLMGHCDTVWDHGTLDHMPLVREDGVLKGPGTFDMKAGLAKMVFALRALRELELETSVTPVIFVNSDEEIGSPESEEHVRMLARRVCRALVLEPALGEEGHIKTSRRGSGNFRIRVRGKAAHSGLAPEKGASAIQELAVVIQTLHSFTDRERGIEVNVGQVSGGVRPNIVAPEATAAVDVRVETVADGQAMQEKILALEATTPGTSLEITGGVDRPPMEKTPRNRQLWEATCEVGRLMGLELTEALSGGGSDGNFTSQYTATLDGLGPVGDGAHAAHEHVVLEHMAPRTALLAGILLLPAP